MGSAELCVVMGNGAEYFSLSLGNKYKHEPVRNFACAEAADDVRKVQEILLKTGPKAK